MNTKKTAKRRANRARINIPEGAVTITRVLPPGARRSAAYLNEARKIVGPKGLAALGGHTMDNEQYARMVQVARLLAEADNRRSNA